MTGHVQQRIDLEHAHVLGPRRDLHDFVTGLHIALFYDAEIETGSAVRDQQRGHPRLLHTHAHAVASDARLRDLKQSFANPVAIANAHFLVRQAVDGEILPELPVREVVPTKLQLPVMIRIDLIDEDGPVFASMTGEVALPVAIDIEAPSQPGAKDRVLPHAGEDCPALPGHILR